MTAATSADDLPAEMAWVECLSGYCRSTPLVGGASGSDVLRSKEKARRSVRDRDVINMEERSNTRLMRAEYSVVWSLAALFDNMGASVPVVAVAAASAAAGTSRPAVVEGLRGGAECIRRVELPKRYWPGEPEGKGAVREVVNICVCCSPGAELQLSQSTSPYGYGRGFLLCSCVALASRIWKMEGKLPGSERAIASLNYIRILALRQQPVRLGVARSRIAHFLPGGVFRVFRIDRVRRVVGGGG